MSRLRTWSFVALAVPVLTFAGCSSSSSTPSTTAQPATTAPPTSSTTPVTIGAIPAADLSPAGISGKAPTIVVPEGAPPTQLESADLIAGSGRAVTDGDSITVQYVLATYSSGKEVQSSWTSQPYTFTLGEGQVIPGWDAGVLGMKGGGRRELIIPPALGYGDASQGPGIAANDTLVFIVDLLKIN